MVSASANARFSFLEEAARHYARTDPSTSAHLNLQNKIEAETQSITQPKKDGSEYCKACGTLRLLGVNTKISIVSDRPKGSKLKKSFKSRSSALRVVLQPTKHLITKCLICHRYDKRLLKSQEPKSKRSALATSVVPPQAGTMFQQPKDTTDSVAKNASSKQRARARKGGLQALLQREKQAPADTGLNLMDFMRKG